MSVGTYPPALPKWEGGWSVDGGDEFPSQWFGSRALASPKGEGMVTSPFLWDGGDEFPSQWVGSSGIGFSQARGHGDESISV